MVAVAAVIAAGSVIAGAVAVVVSDVRAGTAGRTLPADNGGFGAGSSCRFGAAGGWLGAGGGFGRGWLTTGTAAVSVVILAGCDVAGVLTGSIAYECEVAS